MTKKMKKIYVALSAATIEYLKNLKGHIKTFVLCIICSRCKNEDEKLFKLKSIEILKILVLFKNI